MMASRILQMSLAVKGMVKVLGGSSQRSGVCSSGSVLRVLRLELCQVGGFSDRQTKTAPSRVFMEGPADSS